MVTLPPLAGEAIRNSAQAYVNFKIAENKLKIDDFNIKLSNWKANYFNLKSLGASVPPPEPPMISEPSLDRAIDWYTALYTGAEPFEHLDLYAGNHKKLDVPASAFEVLPPAPEQPDNPVGPEDRPGWFLVANGAVVSRGQKYTDSQGRNFEMIEFPSPFGQPYKRWKLL